MCCVLAIVSWPGFWPVEAPLTEPQQAIDQREHDDRRDEQRHRRRAMKPAVDKRCGDCEVCEGRLDFRTHVYLDGVHGLAAVDGFGQGLVDEFTHLLCGDRRLAGL